MIINVNHHAINRKIWYLIVLPQTATQHNVSLIALTAVFQTATYVWHFFLLLILYLLIRVVVYSILLIFAAEVKIQFKGQTVAVQDDNVL